MHNICEYMVKPDYYDDVIDIALQPYIKRISDDILPEMPSMFYKTHK